MVTLDNRISLKNIHHVTFKWGEKTQNKRRVNELTSFLTHANLMSRACQLLT